MLSEEKEVSLPLPQGVTEPKNKRKKDKSLPLGIGNIGTWYPEPILELLFTGIMRISLVLSSPRSDEPRCLLKSARTCFSSINVANEGWGTVPCALLVLTTGGSFRM